MAHPGGRPPKFSSPEEMQVLIDQYFSDEKEPIKTICGLAIALGFVDRRSIYDYYKNPEFSHTIKGAMIRVENGYEKRLSGNNPTGPIFVLKNMNWTDKQTLEVTKFEPLIIKDENDKTVMELRVETEKENGND